MAKLKILFVCGRNQWRSPTAEKIYRNDPRVIVRSAGVSSKSRRKINPSDITWADVILVMEREQGVRIRDKFRNLEVPNIESLEIPDEFTYMNSELIERIKEGTEHFIDVFEHAFEGNN